MFSSPSALVVLSWFGLFAVVAVSVVMLCVITRFGRRRRALGRQMHAEGLRTAQPSSELVMAPRQQRRKKRRWEGEWGLGERAKVTLMPEHHLLEVRVESSELPCDADLGWVIFRDEKVTSPNGKTTTRPALSPVWPVWAQSLVRAPRRSPDPFPGYSLFAVEGTPLPTPALLSTLRESLTESTHAWVIASRGDCIWVRRQGPRAHAGWDQIKATVEALEAHAPVG